MSKPQQIPTAYGTLYRCRGCEQAMTKLEYDSSAGRCYNCRHGEYVCPICGTPIPVQQRFAHLREAHELRWGGAA